MSREEEKLLRIVTGYYLRSHDFNGTPVRSIGLANKEKLIESLVKNGYLDINFGDIHPNPHIKALESDPIEIQLDKIEKLNLEDTCLYPSKKYLREMVKSNKYIGKPFDLMLALGEPQLGFRAFDLSVLEIYRNDPRYHYDTDDIHGDMAIKSIYSEKKGKVYKRDEVFLQTFGFAYNKTFTKRVVAVYIRYLADLTPEHQELWKNKMLRGKYFIHPDYHRATMGSWALKESIFNAFLEELHQINEMANLMGKPPFFREEYARDKKPRGFGFLLRPTLKEYQEFIQLLDKLVSENINKTFFKGDLILYTEKVLSSGIVERTQKGTIILLEEWLNRVSFPDPKPMIETFKKVRKLRQSPAHAVQEDEFNQRYIREQQKLVIEAYGAVRTLRLIFANHPKVKGYTGVPEWLYKAEIRTY